MNQQSVDLRTKHLRQPTVQFLLGVMYILQTYSKMP